MRRLLKWIGITVGGLFGLLVVGVAIAYFSSENRLTKTYDVQPESITISRETPVIERGQYIYTTNCSGCHGDDLSGSTFVNDPALGSIPAPNLTSGQGGAGATYSDEDFIRAIRHGVDTQGNALAFMPSRAFWHYNNDDLAALIAYVQSVPAVDQDRGARSIKLMGRILMTVGALDILSAEVIDHDGVRPTAVVDRGVTSAYGEYLVNISDCRLCHGDSLGGAQPQDPASPPGPDLTPGGGLAAWTAEEFIQNMRTGVTPDGRQVDPDFMPWKEYGQMTDDDLTAVFLYLQSVSVTESVE